METEPRVISRQRTTGNFFVSSGMNQIKKNRDHAAVWFFILRFKLSQRSDQAMREIVVCKF